MRKVLLVSEIFPPQHGGSGRWFWEIYRRFPENSVACFVGRHPHPESTDRDFPHPVYRGELASREWGIRSWTGLKYYLKTWKSVARLARKESIKQLHCGRVLPEGLAALLLKLTHQIPYTCYVHGEDVETALTSRELKFLTRQVIRGAERIVANSQNSKRILTVKWGVPENKITVMTPGVDIEKFCPDPGTPRPERWGGKNVILTVGRLQKRKGQDVMIQALPELAKLYPNIHYCIVGGGEEYESLRKMAEELGVSMRVEFAGEIKDEEMLRYYRHCDLFALPNRRVGNDDEGFGMVLLEAQACSKPVLAGKSGGTRETMEEGRSGKLADCSNPTSLKNAIHSMMRDPANLQSMGKAGRVHVERSFSWAVLADRAIDEFNLYEANKRH